MLVAGATFADRNTNDSDVLQIAPISSESYLLGRHAEVQSTALQSEKPAEDGWTKTSGKTINLGFSRSAHRVRFVLQVEPTTQHVPDWVLSLGTGNVRFATFQHYFEGRVLANLRGGSGLPFSVRRINYREVAFPVVMLPGRHEILVRIDSFASVSLLPVLAGSAAWSERIAFDNLVAGLLFGLLLVLALYNIWLCLLVRESIFFYFAVTLVGALFWSVAETGFAQSGWQCAEVHPQGQHPRPGRKHGITTRR